MPDEVLCLPGGVYAGLEVMVGAAGQSGFACLPDIAGISLVDHAVALGGFYENKAYRIVADSCPLHLGPVYFALVVTDVDAAYGVALRQVGLAIHAPPALGEGGHHVVVEQAGIDNRQNNPDCQSRFSGVPLCQKVPDGVLSFRLPAFLIFPVVSQIRSVVVCYN